MQWMIGLLVYGSHAFGPIPAAYNALAVVIGGASQVIFVITVSRCVARWFPPQDQPPMNPAKSLLAAVEQDINPETIQGIYALRVAAAMVITTMIAHFSGYPNGYWMPMTAAILLRPDFYEATIRGLNRFAGTLIGAGLMTIVLAWDRPGPMALGCLLMLSIFGCLSLLRVNYALFVACATAYVVLLFSLIGLPDAIVAVHRVVATVVGATVALIVSLFPTPVVGPPSA